MVLIQKEGLPDRLKGEIIRIRKSEAWKQLEEGQTEAIRQIFDHNFPKNVVKEVLIREQPIV